MTLVYRFAKPKDLLEKLRRERNRLDAAVTSQNNEEIADHLFNMAVTAFHIKDWLKQNHNGQTYKKSDVENFIKNTKPLSACRDLCNSGKHFTIDKYQPSTQDVYASAGASMVIKVLMVDATRYKAVELADLAIQAWEGFFTQHGVH